MSAERHRSGAAVGAAWVHGGRVTVDRAGYRGPRRSPSPNPLDRYVGSAAPCYAAPMAATDPTVPEVLPDILVHYACGPPFQSMMDLGPASREAVLREGRISHPERYRDPTYVDTRARVENEMHQQFVAAGGEPLRRSPHYALLGRSTRSEAARTPGKRAYVLPLRQLDAARASFTWGDSFTFDPAYRRATGKGHPVASGRVYRLGELSEVLRRWAGSTSRPVWQELEFQLWYDPGADEYAVVDLDVAPGG